MACLEVLVARDACNEGEGPVVRQRRPIVFVVASLIGCAFLLMAGASGALADNPHRGHDAPDVGPVSVMRALGLDHTYSASASPIPFQIDSGGPDILLPGASLLLGSGILTYAILRRR